MGLLQVNGNQIVESQGRSVFLRGVYVGGWLNNETQLGEILKSFSFEYCPPHQGLLDVVSRRLPRKKESFWSNLPGNIFLALIEPER